MKKETEKKFFLFQIFPSDFVAFYCLYQGRIVAMSTQCVRKQFRVFTYN